MELSKKTTLTGVIAISISAILWGLDGIVLTPQLYNLDVGYVVFILHVIPFLLMNIFFYKEYNKLRIFTTSDYLILIIVAFLGGALGTLSIVKALFLLNFEQLTIVVLLQKLQPIFAIGLAAIILKEKLKKTFILWAAIALIASYFMTFGFNLPNFNTGTNTLIAALWALLAAFSFGSSTVFSKKILQKYNFTTATFYRYGFTVLFMLFYIVVFSKFDQFKETTITNWLIFILIAITTGSGAIYLYYYGLKKVKAIIATICELFFPLSAVVFDYMINKTFLSTVQWIGAALLVFSILRLNISKPRSAMKKF
ncbi:MAG: DMT family transporter [Bacteroidales bacterium]|nr:DMT family transporter [Bacteroidales bacterium]